MKLGDELQTGILGAVVRVPEVTNANTGAPLGASRLVTDLARLRLKVAAKLGVKGYQPYERLGLWLRRELKDFVQTTLTSTQFFETGLVARADVAKRVVREHLEERANHTFLLMALLIFALGQDERNKVPSMVHS